MVLLYAFPLLARFENTTFGILKLWPCWWGLRYLVCTLLMAGIYFLMGWVVVNLFTPAFLLGFGCCAMLCFFPAGQHHPRHWRPTRTLRLQPKTLRAKRMEKTKMPRMNERARQDWATLRSLHGKKRLEHIWSYYKLPIVIAADPVLHGSYAVYRQATKKEDVLYLALINIAPGDTLTEQLTAGFARDQGLTGKQQVYLYSGLLLSESEGADEEYVMPPKCGSCRPSPPSGWTLS